MVKYKILINGQNLLVCMEGNLQRLGFYTTRTVEGNTRDEARSLALTLIQNDAKLTELAFNDPRDPPVFLIEELEELRSDFGGETDTARSMLTIPSLLMHWMTILRSGTGPNKVLQTKYEWSNETDLEPRK